MKRILLPLIIITSTSVFGYYLVKPKTTNIDVVILSDVSDSFSSTPNAKEISKMIDFEKHFWDRISYKSVIVDDIDIGTSETHVLEAENSLFSNKIHRHNKIDSFEHEIDSSITSLNGVQIGRNRSSIYLPIARELNLLVASNATERILVYYGDLKEHSSIFSAYDKKDIELLKKHPDSLENRFTSIQSIKNLSGIQVYFVYKPKDAVDNDRYVLLAKFFEKILSKHGATVTITANL